MKYKRLGRFSFLLLMLVGMVVSTHAETTDTYIFTGKNWTAKLNSAQSDWTSNKDAGGFNNNGAQVTTTYTGAGATSPVTFANVSKVVITYNTNKGAGSGTIDLKIGDNEKVSKTAEYANLVESGTETDGRSANYTVAYEYATPQSGAITMTVNVTVNSLYICSMAITYSDSRAATTLTLGDHETTGVVGGTMNVPTAIVKAGDETVSNADVKWESTKTDVATIADGVISFVAPGTTTIKATYDGDNSYMASSASFTLTVAKAPYTTIPAILQDITSKKVDATYQFENLLVTYVNGKYNYVSDGTNGFLFFGDNLGLTAGDKISGTATGKIYTYSGLPELSIESANDLSVQTTSTGNEVTYYTIAPADLQNYINKPVIINNAEYVEAASTNNLTFKVGETEFTVHKQWSIDTESLTAGKTYTLTGVGSVYATNDATTYQIYPISFEEETAEQPAGWRDIKIDLTNGNLLEESEKVQWGAISAFGIAVAEDGAVSRVAADAANAACTISGKWHSNQCWASLTMTVNVEGPVKITCGTQPWNDSPVTVKNGNETIASFSNKGTLWTSTATGNVVTGYYKGAEAATLTIDGGSYPTYIAVEKVNPEDIPNDATLTFDAANAGAEGIAPAAQKVEIGSKVKIPANTTLYIDGKTLTAWTDGTAQYKAGDEVTVNADMTLTPVFTDNTVSFANRTAETTVVWQFGESNGVGTLNAQGKKTILVTQATIGEAVIDMKMDIDATNGKINNVGRGDTWAQCNDGTKMTIPAYKGTAVSFNSYSAGATTTIGGVTATDKAATYTGEAETLDIVAGGIGYIASVTAVYPVPTQAPVSAHTWDFTTWSEETVTNLKAEAAKTTIEDDPDNAGFTKCTDNGALWSDHEKASKNNSYDASHDNCFWYIGGEAEPTANGQAIPELKGLTFNTEYGKARSLAIAVNYPETSLGTYDGGAYLWLGGKDKECFTIKNVKVGSNLTIKLESHKPAEGRGIQLFVGEDQIGENFTPTVAEEKTFTISAEQFGTTETVDVIVKNTNGCHIYYIDAEIIEPQVAAETTVTFDAANAGAEGVAPEAQTVATGEKVTIPANFTLFKEGYTLTAWSDGQKEYKAGETVDTKGEPITLLPVFTKNTFELASRQEAVTVKFDFQRKNGAPKVAWEGKTGLVWVAQATVNGSTIDVPAQVSTSPGKFANGNWEDWAQLNNGTKFTIPSCKGATVSVEAYNELGTGDSPLTIDGQSDYTSAKTISYTIAGSAETIDVVIGSEGSYYRYIQVVLPVVQSQGGGETFVNESAKVVWSMTDTENPGTSEATPKSAFSTIAFDYGTATITGTQGITDENAASTGITGIKFKPATDKNDLLKWYVKPAAGLTFTPTKLTGYVNRCGTDSEKGITISAYTEGKSPTALGTWTALRATKTSAQKPYDATAIYKYTIELTADQQAALASGDGFYLTSTIGVGNTKEGAFGEVTIEGIINGTVANVNKYTLATAVAPEAAGSISVYPKADEYEEGSEVTLTATENFGFDFVNWTNAAGQEVSTEAKFKYTVNSNETLTANFKAVETYELKLTVDGTNDYMVTVSPEPTVVDGKNMYEAGTAVSLTANQYEGLVTFTNWSDGETASSKIVSMTENIELTAFYAQADIIAGWDFYKSGNNGRKADFYAQDNDADALNLVNTESGETSGWLDKSTLGGGGYESFKGAAVNWRTGASEGDVGNWHWQTKVNAEAFTDINVQFKMLYNYNAYQTYDAEYSLDGENWTKFGNITMTGSKAEAAFSSKLPDAANNQKDLYIRMKADKTSSKDGAASANDGNTLAMFFITGTPKLVDDGKAPVLVSNVPATGATGASAAGKIVLTFDERVKAAEGTKATLGTAELTPTVSGKTVTFEYKGLEYSTEYTFTLPANSISDLTDNKLAEAITISFTTMTRPAVTKGTFDAVVSTVEELTAAIAAAQTRADKNTRYRIFIKDGKYTLPRGNEKTYRHTNGKSGSEEVVYWEGSLTDPITYINTNNVSFIGESRDGVIITNDEPDTDEYTFTGNYGKASKFEGIGNSDVFQLRGEGYYWQDLTVETGMEDGRGRDIAIQDRGTKNVYKNVGLRGYQDTWTSNNDNGLYYFEGGYVRGRTDYMCGKGDIFWNGVELLQIAGGYAAVPSKPAKYGWIYKDCVINGEGSGVDGNYTLGRPWGSGTPIALFIDTKMNVVPSAIGWNEMSGGWPARFAEYNSMTNTGSVIDLSGRKKTFGDGHANNPVLTAEEALENSDLHRMYGEWDPTLLTEQAPTPKNVTLTGTTLTWDGSDYALCWAVVKNDKVVDFTTEPTYTIDDASATWAVRAANEMGGLGEAATAGITDGINEVSQESVTDDAIYNIKGMRVKNATRGIYIIGGRKVVVK